MSRNYGIAPALIIGIGLGATTLISIIGGIIKGKQTVAEPVSIFSSMPTYGWIIIAVVAVVVIKIIFGRPAVRYQYV